MDVHDKTTRSKNMAAIRSAHTKPELVVRRIAWKLGYRYRLHYQSGCGRPDLAFVAKKQAIFVHGCFWHRHAGCRYTTFPATNEKFWSAKFADNVKRDLQTQKLMIESGWKILIIWECETRRDSELERRIREFLSP